MTLADLKAERDEAERVRLKAWLAYLDAYQAELRAWDALNARLDQMTTTLLGGAVAS